MQFNITDEEHKAYLLSGLDNRYLSSKTQAAINPNMGINVLETLISEETNIIKSQSSSSNLEAQHVRKESKHCKHCPKFRNHSTAECKKICKNCNGHHWTKQCKSQSRHSVNIGITEETEEPNCMFAIGDCSSEFTIDSACNIHIMKNLNQVQNAVPHSVLVKVGNGSYMKSTHKGTILLPSTNVRLSVLNKDFNLLFCATIFSTWLKK